MTSAASAGEGAVRYLLLQAGDVLCAVPVSQVRRIARALPVHPLPGAAAALLGLAEFSGEPLPVLDLALLVGAPPGAHPAFPVTVVTWAGPPENREAVGLAADAALEIVELQPARIVAGGSGIVIGEAAVSTGAARVLNLEALGAP
jgi:chemotaxis signal transduction protein